LQGTTIVIALIAATMGATTTICAGYGEPDYLWDAQSTLNVNTTTKLSRTYATAIAGNVTHMHFDPITAAFTLVDNLDTSMSVPTRELSLAVWKGLPGGRVAREKYR
jgi:hypothetical protein